jgi:hypothetical protein
MHYILVRGCWGQRRLFLSKLQARSVSTVPKNPFPYPSDRNPSPYQIFHLNHDASPEDIKSRCGNPFVRYAYSRLTWQSFLDFELVRIYHPDSPSCRSPDVSPETVRGRFHSITSAYTALLGKNLDRAGPAANDTRDRVTPWKARKIRRYDFLQGGGGLDERWKEYIFMGAVIFVCLPLSFALRSVDDCGIDSSCVRGTDRVD